MNRKEKEKVQVAIYQLTNLLQRDKDVQIPADGVLEFLVDLKPKEFDINGQEKTPRYTCINQYGQETV